MVNQNLAVALNFSKREKKEILELLKSFPKKKTKTEFEQYRCEIDEDTVTLYTSGKLVIQGKNAEKTKNMILSNLNLTEEVILGFDETGRGEHSGPFVVSCVLGDTKELLELRDSKKTSNISKKQDLVTKNALAISDISINAQYLDLLRKRGFTINKIESSFIDHMINFFKEFEDKLNVKIDGARFPLKYKKAKFIVKGDDKEPVIGAASVNAKKIRQESQDKGKRETWKTKK